MTPKLSILICSLEKRKPLLDKLLDHLELQRSFLKNPSDVEFWIESDNGGMSTGEKRNLLLENSRGDYIMYVDDDDLLAPNALELILQAIETGVDAIGINLIMTWNGEKTERSFHFGEFTDKEWFDIPDPLIANQRVYFRGFNHLNPIKREIAMEVKFPEITEGEDKVYSNGVSKLVKTFVNIQQPIYFYLFNSNK